MHAKFSDERMLVWSRQTKHHDVRVCFSMLDILALFEWLCSHAVCV